MVYEMMMGLQVRDSKLYQKYRNAMGPLLETHGGGFRYDFVVSEVLKSSTPEPINRVFAIYFESKSRMKDFFENPAYKKVRQEFFDKSVDAITTIASYERD